MVEIRLHGALGRDYGRVWNLDISTVQEAVEAISRARKGFKQAIMKLDRMGMVFRVRSREHDFGNDEVSLTLGPIERIDIIPILRGASAGIRFVLGAVLTVIGVVYQMPLLTSMGVSLMFGSVAEWLSPTPKQQDQGKSLNSWTYQGPMNSATNGQCVPLIFGEVLVGSVPISAGISTSRVTPDDSTDAAVTIGGKVDNSFSPMYASPVSYKLVYSAGVYNIADPLQFTWTVSGFATATQVRVSGADSATVEITLTYTGIAGDALSDTGTVEVSVTGMESTGDPPEPITRTSSVSPTVAIQWNYEHGGS